jgi:hypothetical protein
VNIKVDKEKIKGVVIAVILMSICLAILIPSAIVFYNHRVVESKQYDCTATITDKEFHPEYTTYSTTVDSDGNRHRHSHHHPAEYYIYYTVIFDGGTYAGNKDKVSDRYYYQHNSGDKVQAIFIQQWRADNSETYEIKLVG